MNHPRTGTPPSAGLRARYCLRPARATDLEALVQLARASAVGITSLPDDTAALQAKLSRSLEAFASDDDASGEEAYLFVLEDLAAGGALVGTSGISAAAGFNDRFYCYRNEFTVQASPALGERNRIHTLHLCHDLTGVTLLTGFHVEDALATGPAPQLLSRGRLAFIAAHAERFSERIAAENPGLADEQGRSPFWDGVGRRFFAMDYTEAEQLSGGGSPKAFIAELMPQSPLYVPLLPASAQWALGQLHPVAELPFNMLVDEGLDGDTYVNLFDGGPTAEGRLQGLRSVRRRRPLKAVPAMVGSAETAAARAPGMALQWLLIDNGRRAGFAALLLPLPADTTGDQAMPLWPGEARALGWQPGNPLWCAPLGVGDWEAA